MIEFIGGALVFASGMLLGAALVQSTYNRIFKQGDELPPPAPDRKK